MDADIRRWAAGYLVAQGHEPCPARISAVHDAVVMVLQTGLFGDARSAAIYDQVYAAYGDAFIRVCHQRGLRHRRITANDN